MYSVLVHAGSSYGWVQLDLLLLLGCARCSCAMRPFGFADRDPEETLFYYEHVSAR